MHLTTAISYAGRLRHRSSVNTAVSRVGSRLIISGRVWEQCGLVRSSKKQAIAKIKSK
ncbi:hypothetical protein [Nostoc sp. UHCC 0251]|uniref:hypothetical protein n=1 Tax=Nostoc sp. UHCC 0251 TaxID=3110240 RepID=UPI002B1F4448|nr:hypothetical protein [Nostoc sp. UHCC 0251]MEA5621498.1 hypothetical protein [Nostoc sp. UHCC 0251]